MDILIAIVLLFGQPEAPHPHPYFTSHAPLPLLVVCHSARWDLPRLWTRGGFEEISASDMADECYSRFYDPALRAKLLAGNFQVATIYEHWAALYQGMVDHVARIPVRFCTQQDIDELGRFVTGEHHVLEIMPNPDSGYAHVSADQSVHIPHVPWLPTGYPGRAVIYHEMTHYMQMECEAAHLFCDLAPQHATYEFAAMIVESAEVAREGMSAIDWQAMDRKPWWLAEAFPDYCNFEAVCPPRMNGALFHDYVIRYGPTLTGNMIEDLTSIRHWVSSFEDLGFYVPTSEPYNADWMELIRTDEQYGLNSPMVSTCQTYMSVNRCPSAYPPCAALPNDTPVPNVDTKAVMATMEPTNPHDSAELAARRFLERCE